MILRYLGIAIGFVGAGAMLTPMVASIVKNMGIASAGANDQSYLLAGLGLALTLVGLLIWALSQINDHRP